MPSGSGWDLRSPDASLANAYWGSPTSNVNFCEADYVITHYIAEFFNTLTSLAYIAYGIHGIGRFKRQDISLFSTPNLSYWALIGVGIFSGLYHTTLKYHTQMSDELSMHLAIGTILLQLFTFQEPPPIQRRNAAIILGIIIPFVIYHCVTDEFVLHVALFFCMSWIVGFRARYIIKTKITDPAHRKKLSGILNTATITAMSAYAIWNIDVHFCPQLVRAKEIVGFPASVFLELHGYWHIMTAVSAYSFMAVIEFLLSPDDVPSRGVGFAWPAKSILQDLVPQKGAHGYVNGHGKKLT
ncbi:alkaline phytoceramidase [Teratosphaeria nubilosa]|uniref:Alkaline phytoceramidase n=1 Tax=Teratosphaeria nubilosa TaxID=161662 RepID=A0A6G1L1T0_9PEZI|nr:alkaline phytoceramidase [Teratosphaeria nubilosa]